MSYEEVSRNVRHAPVERAGRRTTSSLVSFHTKLLSHGDGKAMSRLYNARTHARATPRVHTHAELPSSLNKLARTQMHAHTVYPLFMKIDRESNINNPFPR